MGVGGIVREFGVDMYTAVFKMDNQQLHTVHGELCSMLCACPGGSGIWGRMDKYMCMIIYFCCLPETITKCLISYTPV